MERSHAVAVEMRSAETVEAAPEAVKSVEPAAEAVTVVRVPHSERCSRGRAMSAVREVEACVSAALPVCAESGAKAGTGAEAGSSVSAHGSASSSIHRSVPPSVVPVIPSTVTV